MGPGLFAGNVGADAPEDDGLTIRGTLSGGSRATTLRGVDLGYEDSDIAVALGSCGQGQVELRDVAVDTEGADSYVEAISLDGGSDLTNVRAENQAAVPSDAQSVVSVCQRGSQIDRSEIVATGGDTGILSFDGVKVTDSTLSAEDTPAVIDYAFFDARPLILRRSVVQLPPTGAAPAVAASALLTVDSSLITGGQAGVVSFTIDKWKINNSTIDPADPGVGDPSNTPSLALDPSFSGVDPRVDVDSSILVDGIDATFGQGTVTCSYSDLPAPVIGDDWVDQCQIGADGNVTTDPSDIFVGGTPYDWDLKPDSAAIDSGEPGPVPPGLSSRDIVGNPRLVAGLVANCAAPVRDKGAYEYVGVPCSLQSPTLTNGGAPQVGTKLGASPGRWSNHPTSYQNQFLRCDAAGENCTPIMPRRAGRSSYTAKPEDVGSTLRVSYVASNAVGDSDPAVSAPSGVVSQDAPVNISPPAIVDGASPTVGIALTSTPGTWSSPPSTYLRQWLRCDAAGDNCSAVTDYRERRSYTPRGADAGSTLKIRAKATNAGGESAPATSAASGVVG